MSDLWATFTVREDMLKDLRRGTVIEVEIPALRRSSKMRVFHLAAMGDFATWQATSEKNSFDLKTFRIKARSVSAIDGLRPGMTVRWHRNKP